MGDVDSTSRQKLSICEGYLLGKSTRFYHYTQHQAIQSHPHGPDRPHADMIYPRLIIPLLAYSQRVLVTEWHVEVKWA
jgi:hypothetical protein